MAPFATDDIDAPDAGFDSFLEFLFDADIPKELSTEGTEARAEVRKLVAEVHSVPESADELLRTYSGKEKVLIKSLSKMKVQEEENAE
eukprot:CAMPEP_0172528368 /NCGR_PEP_ID=MMETSP1067-20121228/2790_1 /TAXON_ID=265564 ORGANISM="Thalassiosira punctigera, Strain Tpunct2005C2" /NCGR_SAMPLE_ID=MMETSP1067 /ASSEMBLY_ACC=CAM_ASM_000444 /LENGTH=87 /DNA_ID=CAMNT_0013312265 /DNA_START=102 /DNA_END=362 /DNA_ORIENTATION=+